ncbi:SRPBCC domain-containing protein [Streptomyces sp. NPDC060027]|uniref:SRPBCC family protein n=1 Tax=Streptomyces sp. NPDC060027 TaxID=3347040 RepID=UPI0036A883D3
MLIVRWADADPSRPAEWTITRTLEQEGRSTRLFLVHEGFDPDDPAQMMARKIMDGGWSSHVMRAPGNALDRMWSVPHSGELQAVVGRTTAGSQVPVKAVTAGPPRVHVHLPMHLHMNRAMIRVS